MPNASELLYFLIRESVGGTPMDGSACVLQEVSSEDWSKVIDLAFEQGVAAMTVDGLGFAHDNDGSTSLTTSSDNDNQEGLDLLDSPELEDLKYEWFGSVFQDEQENSDQISVLKEMASRWAQEGCRMMLMKGQAAALYYPVPSHRTTGDIDCYFLGDYDKANSVAEKTGAVVDTHWYKHSQIHYKGEMFENHQYFVHTRDGKRGKG